MKASSHHPLHQTVCNQPTVKAPLLFFKLTSISFDITSAFYFAYPARTLCLPRYPFPSPPFTPFAGTVTRWWLVCSPTLAYLSFLTPKGVLLWLFAPSLSSWCVTLHQPSPISISLLLQHPAPPPSGNCSSSLPLQKLGASRVCHLRNSAFSAI